MTVQEALPGAILRLTGAGVPDAPRDARKLLAHALGIAPDRLTLHLADPLMPDVQARFAAAVQARAARQPLSQILGQRLFWGRPFRVTPDVLDPRPETETLIAAALRAPFSRLLDLGTGSGAILLTLLAECPQATGLGTDLSPGALAIAAENAAALGLGARAGLALSDWFASITGRFDLITANPPYIALSELPALAPEVRDWEPRMALIAGADGLAAYRVIVAQAPAHLAAKGRLIVETGPTQGADVAALFRENGLQDVAILPDLDGRDRVVIGHAA